MSPNIAEFLRRVIPARFRPIGYLTHLAISGTRCHVATGPFAGTEYVDSSCGSAYIPKLLGMYERELNPYVEAACAALPDRIVDVGAVEGYYAVGLARRNPQAHVVAFEMEESGRKLLSDMVALNDVSSRVEIRGRAEPADLHAVLAGAVRPLVVCDVEGYEATLLDPAQAPALRYAMILVEMHDFITPGITEQIENRFTATHRVTRVWQEPRSSDEFPYRTLLTRLLPRSYLDWSVSEWRPERMSWLWMEPSLKRTHGDSSNTRSAFSDNTNSPT